MFQSMNAIFAPPPDLPPALRQHRFWIWLQLIVIRLRVIALRGRLVAFTTATDRHGNVYLVHIGDAQPQPAPKPDPFAFAPSKAYRAAVGGDVPDPCFFRRHTLQRVSMDKMTLMRIKELCAMDACLRGHLRKNHDGVPRPDT